MAPEPSSTHNHAFGTKRSEEFVDIHNIGGFNPTDLDVLICDIGDNQLKHHIAAIAAITYYIPATEEEANMVVHVGNCFIYGSDLRTMFPALANNRSGKLFGDLVGIQAMHEDTPLHVSIAGLLHSVFRAPECSHFASINTLGADFLNAQEVSLVNSPRGVEAKLFFWLENVESSRRGGKVVAVGRLEGGYTGEFAFYPSSTRKI
ncbi:hypothetical protein HOY82DRAFT_618550 [Tuber indicum]|nr:hypothetical protein HOY82DRAFT_618550 [Tuber indicum]